MSQEQRIAVQDLRDSPRKNVRYKFKLDHPDFRERECETRDLSLSGAFVEGKFVEIGPGDTINVEFESSTDKSTKHRFSSTVTRVTSEGLGLKFFSLDMDTYGALLDLTLRN
ncbi:MAG: PilZ domain-containing protein [Acidiferrobacterales bacterium]